MTESPLPAVNQGRVDLLALLEARIEETSETIQTAMVTLRLGLKEVYDQQLWREAGAVSFAAYCADRWAISTSSAYRAVGWATEVLREQGILNAADFLTARNTDPTPPALPSVRATTAARSDRRPPRGKTEAIDVPARPESGHPSQIRRPQPVDLPVERPVQLALFGLVDQLAGHLDEAAKATDADRHQLAVRLRAMADQIDPPKKPAPVRRDVTPMFKKGT